MFLKQAVVRKHNEPRPSVAMCQNSLHSQSLDGSTGLPEEPITGNVDKCSQSHWHRGIARFLGIDPKLNQVVTWSLHTFPENFMQIGPAVFS